MALQPSPITLDQAQTRLTEWNNALEAASTGSSYSVDGQTVTRQDVPTIRAEITRWSNTVAAIHQRLKGNIRPMAAQAVFPTPGRGGGNAIIPNSLWVDGQT